MRVAAVLLLTWLGLQIPLAIGWWVLHAYSKQLQEHLDEE